MKGRATPLVSLSLVLVAGWAPSARAADDPAAIMLDLHMMAITGGRARSLAEFEALLAETNLGVTKVTPTSSGSSVIEAA